MCPPWLPPSGMLLKLASEYSCISREFKSNFGIVIWDGQFLMCLITLFIVWTYVTVAFLTLVLVSHTCQLISGLDIHATQLIFLSAFHSNVISLVSWLFFVGFVSNLISFMPSMYSFW